MGKKDEPYYGTDVPASKSQEDVRRMLLKYGAVAMQFTEMTQPQTIEIKWACTVKVGDKSWTQPIRIRAPYEGKRIEQVYRALFYMLKSKFESTAFGIKTFEEEFLPYFEMRLPSGETKTIAEMALPQLSQQKVPFPEYKLLGT